MMAKFENNIVEKTIKWQKTYNNTRISIVERALQLNRQQTTKFEKLIKCAHKKQESVL